MNLTDLLSPSSRQQHQEEKDAGHRRLQMDPMAELEMADAGVALAAEDEHKRCFDGSCHPKPPHAKEDGVTSLDGSRMVDIQRDTPAVEEDLGTLRAGPDPGDVESDILGVDVNERTSVTEILEL